jgi:Protein of unknown function (DUF1059)
VIDCECGTTLKAATDGELTQEVRAHVDAEHPDMELDDEELSEMVEERAYDADDA